jgi:hypothetical protein
VERGSGFIYQDAVHLIDNSVIQLSLDHFVLRGDHVITEIVKTELIVGSIRDVCGVSCPSLGVIETVDYHTHLKSEELVNRTHPFCVTPGEVIVDSDNMNTLSGQGVKVRRQSSSQRLAFSGPHFRDSPFMKDCPAHDLLIKVALAQHPDCSFPNYGERLSEKIIQ